MTVCHVLESLYMRTCQQYVWVLSNGKCSLYATCICIDPREVKSGFSGGGRDGVLYVALQQQ